MSNTRENLQWMDRAMCVAAGLTRWLSFTRLDKYRVCRGCPVRGQCSQWMGTRPVDQQRHLKVIR